MVGEPVARTAKVVPATRPRTSGASSASSVRWMTVISRRHTRTVRGPATASDSGEVFASSASQSSSALVASSMTRLDGTSRSGRDGKVSTSSAARSARPSGAASGPSNTSTRAALEAREIDDVRRVAVIREELRDVVADLAQRWMTRWVRAEVVRDEHA